LFFLFLFLFLFLFFFFFLLAREVRNGICEHMTSPSFSSPDPHSILLTIKQEALEKAENMGLDGKVLFPSSFILHHHISSQRSNLPNPHPPNQ
jgi:hypothetical protein